MAKDIRLEGDFNDKGNFRKVNPAFDKCQLEIKLLLWMMQLKAHMHIHFVFQNKEIIAYIILRNNLKDILREKPEILLYKQFMVT